jgi:hypothetical protein
MKLLAIGVLWVIIVVATITDPLFGMLLSAGGIKISEEIINT